MMRSLTYLIPSFFFLIAFVSMAGSQDLVLARMQGEASSLSIEMNRASNQISAMVQDVSLGKATYEDIQENISAANLRMDTLRDHIDQIWLQMDDAKVRAARDEKVRRVLKVLGISFGVAALIIIGERSPELVSQCLIAASILIGLLAVQV